ncbi:hypothetical protein CAPTEDRAFT_204235 [Capitella teleta]|uniref:Uncharacterized protein n=1 Tax=Capitella teleta TaxID=283909 RepID=R7UZM8_CAPTE|nr:hypothetical protein CAPTEDRAFT_204235 [Capitella teleta]|eukprot:ELU11687.1 hypothetical protein CAPTEDRAFT_204235 [Capitella teleta]
MEERKESVGEEILTEERKRSEENYQNKIEMITRLYGERHKKPERKASAGHIVMFADSSALCFQNFIAIPFINPTPTLILHCTTLVLFNLGILKQLRLMWSNEVTVASTFPG